MNNAHGRGPAAGGGARDDREFAFPFGAGLGCNMQTRKKAKWFRRRLFKHTKKDPNTLIGDRRKTPTARLPSPPPLMRQESHPHTTQTDRWLNAIRRGDRNRAAWYFTSLSSHLFANDQR